MLFLLQRIDEEPSLAVITAIDAAGARPDRGPSWPAPSSCVPGAVRRVASEDAETDTTSCHDDRRYPATNDTQSLGNSPNKIPSEGPTAMFVGTADATKDGSAVSANGTASRRMPARVCRLRRCKGGPRKTATAENGIASQRQ